METPATTTAPEGFTDADFEKYAKFEAAKETRRIAGERKKAGLTTEPSPRRNETGASYNVAVSHITRGASGIPKELLCDETDAICRQANRNSLVRTVVLAAAGELFWVPAGHRLAVFGATLPEVDPADVTDEPTLQDRLLLGEMKAAERAAEVACPSAARVLTDLEAQRRILDERILQQQSELERRQSHVRAAAGITEEFLGTHTDTWREEILSGAKEAALEAVKQAAAAAERRRPQIHTVDDLRRAESGDEGPGVYAAGGNGQVGQVSRLKVDRGR